MKLNADALMAAQRGESDLTERQREILALVVRGHTNGEIAAVTNLSLSTVKWHMSEILTKLGFSSRDEAALYWESRNRTVNRLGRWAQGLLAMPALKWAAGGTAAALAAGAVGLGLWLSGGDAQTLAADEPLPPFELSGVIRTHENGTLVSEDKVTWKYNDRRHWILESESSNGRVIIDVADGSRRVTGGGTARDSLTWTESPLDGPEASGPFQSLLGALGPRYETSLQQIVGGGIVRWGQGNRIAGTELLLGGNVTIIEFDAYADPAPPPAELSEKHDSGFELVRVGVGHTWVDNDSLFVLRFDYPTLNGVWSGEITQLEFKRHSKRTFVLPIAAAVASSVPTQPEPTAPVTPLHDEFGVPVPTGWYGMAGVPAGFELAAVSSRGLPSQAPRVVVTLLAAGASSPSASNERSLVLAQRAVSGAAPLADPAPVLLTSGIPATRSEEAGRLVLNFSDAYVIVTIRGNLVTREELLAFANSLVKRP